MARCTWYNIMWSSLSVTCSRSVVFFWYSGFLHQKNWLPLYSWNIVESGIEYHNPNSMFCDKNKMIDIYFTSGINSLDLRLNSVTLEILYYLKLFFSPFFFSLLRPRKWHQKQIQQILSYDGADQSRSLMWKVGYYSLLWRHSDDNWKNGDILMC